MDTEKKSCYMTGVTKPSPTVAKRRSWKLWSLVSNLVEF